MNPLQPESNDDFSNRNSQVFNFSETQSAGNESLLSPTLKNILNLSPCVISILDLCTQHYKFITNNTLDLFGYNTENYIAKGHGFQEQIIHPDDQLSYSRLVNKVWKALTDIPPTSQSNYKFSLDYRILKPSGDVTRILEQNTILQQDVHGQITHLLCVYSDITRWKNNYTQLAYLNSEVEKQHFIFYSDNSSEVIQETKLSKRELQIVRLLSEGYNSKCIAEKLFISFNTVNTHRQNMIEKTKVKNTSGLIQFASLNGLI